MNEKETKQGKNDRIKTRLVLNKPKNNEESTNNTNNTTENIKIECKDIDFHYGNNHALKNVSLQIMEIGLQH